MIDDYKEYKVVETVCNQCGERIIQKANFIEHRCRCGNWINITAFTPVVENVEDNEISERPQRKRLEWLKRWGWTEDEIQGIMERAAKATKRREELDKIYGTERSNNECLESDFEECFWNGYDKGYARGYAEAKGKVYIKGI